MLLKDFMQYIEIEDQPLKQRYPQLETGNWELGT
jgi:hypothetical protein